MSDIGMTSDFSDLAQMPVESSIRFGPESQDGDDDPTFVADLEAAVRANLGLDPEPADDDAGSDLDTPTTDVDDQSAGGASGEGSAPPAVAPDDDPDLAPTFDPGAPETDGFVIAEDDQPDDILLPGDADTGVISDDQQQAPAFDANAMWETYAGRPVSEQEHAGIMEFVSTVQSLPPVEQQIITEIIEGRFDPLAYVAAERIAAMAPTPAPTPVQQVIDPYGDPYGDPYNPATAPVAAVDPALEARLAAMEQFAQQQAQQTYQASQAEQATRINAAADAFAQSHPELRAEDLNVLRTRVRTSGDFPSALQAASGNVEAAVSSLMEREMWGNTIIRDRLIQERTARERVAQSTEDTRKARAAALSGGGQVVTPTAAPAQPAPAPKNKVDQARAIAAAIDAGGRA